MKRDALTPEEQRTVDEFFEEMIARGHAERVPGTEQYRMTVSGRRYARAAARRIDNLEK
jgi:hypothetical protein